jgi:hypothetical protein
MTGSNGPCKTTEKTGRQYSFYDFHTCLYLRGRLCEEASASGWRFGLGQIVYSMTATPRISRDYPHPCKVISYVAVYCRTHDG